MPQQGKQWLPGLAASLPGHTGEAGPEELARASSAANAIGTSVPEQ